MTNIEKKKKLWAEILPQYEHLDCEIDVDFGSSQEKYFHPIFVIGENIVIHTQCDIDRGADIYSSNFRYNGDTVYVSYNGLSVEKIEWMIQNVAELEENLSFLHCIFYGEKND